MPDPSRNQPPSPNYEDRSISLLKANVAAAVAVVPVMLLGVGLFTLFWGADRYAFEMTWWAFVLLLVGIVVHELLHGVGWQLVKRAEDVTVEYGVKWQMLTPYAHLTGPIHLRAYRIGTWLPGAVLGLLPMALGLTLGRSGLLTFGIVFTWAAAGDFMVLWSLRDLPPDVLVEDHPDRAGACVLRR
jgi:hypothetical protein